MDEGGWRGRKSECDCPCRGESEEHGGVEMAHFGLADVIERALSRARLLYYGLSNGCDGLEKTGGGEEMLHFYT